MILRLFFDIAYASINENTVIKVHNTSYWHFQYTTSTMNVTRMMKTFIKPTFSDCTFKTDRNLDSFFYKSEYALKLMTDDYNSPYFG